MRTNANNQSDKELLGLGQDDTAIPPGVVAAFNIEQELGSNRDDDEDSYDEQQEIASLVVASVKHSRRRQTESQGQTVLQSPRPSESTWIRKLFGSRHSLRNLGMIVVAFSLVFVFTPRSNQRSSKHVLLKKVKPLLQFKCPAPLKKNDKFAQSMSPPSSVMSNKDRDAWMRTFRDVPYDKWGNTYSKIKWAMSDWKSFRFAPYLRSNSSIYNAGMGVGLDALMTLELLREKKGLSGLTVYGSDIEQKNIAVAKSVLSRFLGPVGGKYGTLCTADSTLLHEFLMEDSFDLVFAGRIPPLANPLQFSGDKAEVERKYNELCSVSPSKEQAKQLKESQAKQDEWYKAWVVEMIRIAKPGAPIIVEQVSLPLCQNMYDKGGVSPSFWNSTSAITTKVKYFPISTSPYKLQQQRYHVFMVKEETGDD